MLVVYMLSPTVVTLEKVTNTLTKLLDPAAVVSAVLKDGPNITDTDISGSAVSGSLVAGTSADYVFQIPANLDIDKDGKYYLHVNLNLQAGYFVVPVRVEYAPSA